MVYEDCSGAVGGRGDERVKQWCIRGWTGLMLGSFCAALSGTAVSEHKIVLPTSLYGLINF
jgi:hypothetical protein